MFGLIARISHNCLGFIKGYFQYYFASACPPPNMFPTIILCTEKEQSTNSARGMASVKVIISNIIYLEDHTGMIKSTHDACLMEYLSIMFAGTIQLVFG